MVASTQTNVPRHPEALLPPPPPPRHPSSPLFSQLLLLSVQYVAVHVFWCPSASWKSTLKPAATTRRHGLRVADAGQHGFSWENMPSSRGRASKWVLIVHRRAKIYLHIMFGDRYVGCYCLACSIWVYQCPVFFVICKALCTQMQYGAEIRYHTILIYLRYEQRTSCCIRLHGFPCLPSTAGYPDGTLLSYGRRQACDKIFGWGKR